ncbi:hypothetical protein NDU88_006075 [Pleurodeles waltl]|uniref:Uncharacterized protein n=1 Tax=Pleurodeles waltl TaxID=8319 RepID=A0AAV7MLA1_PLEWA|nr:hypothetical protein NDU88_006075 [Pleurodeles waltl]
MRGVGASMDRAGVERNRMITTAPAWSSWAPDHWWRAEEESARGGRLPVACGTRTASLIENPRISRNEKKRKASLAARRRLDRSGPTRHSGVR